MQEAIPRASLLDHAAASYGPLLWSAAGLVLYLLGGVAALFLTAFIADPLLGVAGYPVEAGALGLSVRNAMQPVVWGALVAAISAPIGRRLVPGIRFGLDGWLVLAAGLALAGVTWFLIEEFVRSRYAYVDVEYVGFSVLAWPALVAIALAGWAALAVPRGSAIAPVALVALAAMGLGIALLPSVLGAADGIDAENIPLAALLLGDVVYAMSAVALIFRRAMAPHRS